jgi:biofilm protein TabA
MIVTDPEHLAEQAALTPALAQALAFLQETAGVEMPDGRVEIDGQRVYALFQSYETSAGEPRFEVHRRYIDIQYIAAGVEVIGWAPVDAMLVAEPYDPAKDAAFGSVPPGKLTSVLLGAGQLAVLYPADAHAPKLAAGAPAAVKKIVVKVALGDKE